MASDRAAICMELLDRFMRALNAHDAPGMDACMHFPHVRIAAEQVVVYEAAGQNPMDLFQRLEERDGWSHSVWDDRKVLQESDAKVHLGVRYTRYRSDESVIGTYDSLYIATLVDGVWGLQGRSSFGP